MHVSFAKALTLIVIVSIASSSQAAIIGPYSVDANTLHLWHLNDSAVPIQDASGVATPINLASLGGGTGQSLGATSFAGFGTAYSGVATAETGIFAKTPVSGAGDDTSTASFRGPGGAYTYEMILRADFDPTVTPTSYQLFSFENDSSSNRDFQFILAHGPNAGTAHLLKFIQISGSVVTVDSSLFSIEQGHWYHVAAAYNGNQGAAGNLVLYWTDMTSNAANTVATSVGTGTLANDLAATAADFAIGAEARNSSGNTGQFLGLIDEVRISGVARGPGDFIFAVPEASAFWLAAFSMVSAWVGFRRR